MSALSEKNTNPETNDLLIEIGLEELPPQNLEEFADGFQKSLDKAFKSAHLNFLKIETFVAPRRLAAIVRNLQTSTPAQTIVKRGPAKSAAFDGQGKPTQAALGFATACETTLDNIGFQESEKGSFLVFEKKMQGEASDALIPKILHEVLQGLSLPKKMRWGARSEFFVRPVHWVVLLFGNKAISAEFFGIKSGAATKGHRFHHPKPILLGSPAEYETYLFEQGKVIADYTKRRQSIEAQLIKTVEEKLTKEKKLKAKPFIDPSLLDQVTGLVEWPVVLLGKFDRDFLKLPEEALISSMQVHQKCFPIYEENQERKLLPYFLIVSNIESQDPETVIQGNERVMHARLHDAAFYYREDKKTPLQDRREHLKQVVFQHGLGTLWDKSERIAELSVFMCEQMGVQNTAPYKRVAELCKADLSTLMVLEFPELQGIMGKDYYGPDSEGVGDAIEGHYHPRFAQDTLPNSLMGAVIAIADRIDSLVGLFGLGKRPTGDKDPFALRRQALAILRIILEEARFKSLQLIDLQSLINKASEIYAKDKEKYNKLLPIQELNKVILDFFYERLRAWYHEKGFHPRSFDAVLAVEQSSKPINFDYRLKAVEAFQKLAEAENLSAANKRVRNILEKSLEKNEGVASGQAEKIEIDESLLLEEAEKTLAKKLQEKELEIQKFSLDQYTEALLSLAELKEPVDRFFDTVMVMVEDPRLKNNRLNLLRRLRALFLKIADISVL